VHLDPGAIQLVLQRRLAQLLDRHFRVISRSGQHGVHRPKQLGDEAGELGRVSRQRGPGHTRQIAGHHPSPSHSLGGNAGRLGDGFQHQAFNRTLA
jgi:hypothetical protein